MKNINNYVSYLISSSGGLKFKDKSANKCICEYIENIIFNITSISAIIAFINHSKIITKENIKIVYSYIKEACGSTRNSMRGGDGAIVLPAEFYGNNSGNYSASNNTVDVLNIDFNNGILRPQIGGSKIENPVPKEISKILSNYKLKISSDLCKKLSKVIEMYILCLIQKLKKKNKMISSSEIKKTITSNKLFNIFK
jgi:histone H3/H4